MHMQSLQTVTSVGDFAVVGVKSGYSEQAHITGVFWAQIINTSDIRLNIAAYPFVWIPRAPRLNPVFR
jgi:hypothetical protein